MTSEPEVVVVSPKRKPKQPPLSKRKSYSSEWFSEHDVEQEVFDYVRDGYNNVVGIRVDGGIYA